MEIMFLGPIGKVTGSCTWLRDTKRNLSFLVDCGMQQGESTAMEWNNQAWPFEPTQIQFVILTHAHIDHSGLVPCLCRDGFKGKVYCTEETAIISEILLKDAAKIDGSLFSERDISKIKWSPFKAEPVLGKRNPVADDLFIQFHRTGHILGAVSASIYWGKPKDREQKSIVFSGDIGPQREDHEALPIIRHTMNPGVHDYAVLESTYGNKVRNSDEKNPELRREHLKRLLSETIEKNGTLIIPCFALGRSQDIIFDLHAIVAQQPEAFDIIDFFLDYPLAKKLLQETTSCWDRMDGNAKKVRPAWIGKQVYRLLGFTPNDPVSVRETQKALRALVTDRDDAGWIGLSGGNEVAENWKPLFSLRDAPNVDQFKSGRRPTVIVTGSGNCEAGKVSKWLPELLRDESVTVALTGFCASGTVGRDLLHIADLGLSERQLHTSKQIAWETTKEARSVPIAKIKATIDNIKGYSAHGDQSDLMKWVFENNGRNPGPSGKTVFLQHGDDINRQALKEALQYEAHRRGLDLQIVTPGDTQEWISLETGGPEDEDARALNELLARRPDLRKVLG